MYFKSNPCSLVENKYSDLFPNFFNQVEGQDAEELENLLENDTDYKSYSALAAW